MRVLLATLWKELLLLGRDRVGLLVLFVMPTVLVIVVSLVQNGILEATGEGGLKVLYIDRDGGELGRRLGEELSAAGLTLIRPADGMDATAARRAVAAGDYPYGIVVPAGASEALHQGASRLAASALQTRVAAGPATELEVFFDPTVQGAFRLAVTSSLRLAALGLETEEKMRAFAKLLPKPRPASRSFGRPAATAGPPAGIEKPLLSVRAASEQLRLPTAVQQNVPAWALFGMFFIVVPLAGTLLRERQEGTLQRLRTFPFSPFFLLAGKIGAYVLVCLVQFALMLLVGMIVLPLLGTSVLELGGAPGAVFFLALCAGLAATGFGLLVGTLAGSYEQASMAGAVSVVIAAALGGVMAPVYVMPATMQALSAVSPLAWGLNGFLDLFVRGGTLADIVPNALSLLAFFAVTLAAAWAVFCRQGRRGA